jgi:hypothetical protein
MYKILIRPVLTYAYKTWTLSKANERRLSLFERRVLHIFSERKREGNMAKKHNYELYKMCNDSRIVDYIKVKRLAWAGHLMRMNDNKTLKKYLTQNWIA